jgi:hypothetical protein
MPLTLPVYFIMLLCHFIVFWMQNNSRPLGEYDGADLERHAIKQPETHRRGEKKTRWHRKK